MNLLVLTCLLCLVVCSTLATQGSNASAPESGDAGGPLSPTSSASPQGSPDEDDDKLGADADRQGARDGSGGTRGRTKTSRSKQVPPDADAQSKGGKKKTKGKGKKKNKLASGGTTPFNPEHTFLTSGFTSTLVTTEDPCTSTHEHYCIHGSCKYLDGLAEPVCTCWKDYDGERCEIHSLGTRSEEGGGGELAQTALVIVAVVLSVVSCLAFVLLTCAHYRSHKHFLASYLGMAAEQEKLQMHVADVLV